jgi:4-amino-4-deoxy-L-arabinose transferase-like glycosyltransferase
MKPEDRGAAAARSVPHVRSYNSARRLIRPFSRPSAATLCALLIGMFYLATIREGHDWGDDFSMYIRHAQNIARGEPYAETGYIYNPQNPDIGPRLYPPGFPVFLAPVVGIFGLDLRPMKILVLAFFIGSLLVMISLFRNVLSMSYVAVLVLIVGLNPLFWELKDHVLSDIPFLFFALLSLRLFAHAGAPDASGGRRATLAVLSGVAAYAAYATRTLALMLIPCFVAHDLSRYRRIGTNAALATAVVVVLAGLQHVVWFHDVSYVDQISNPVTAAQQNVPAYLRDLSDLWENSYSSDVRKIAFLGSGALAAFGYVNSLRAGVSVFHLFPPLYLAPVMMWPSYQGMRLLVPVVPFYFCYCLLGVRRIDAAVERRWKARNAVLVVFLAAVLVSYAGRYSTLPFGPLREGIAKKESRELFEFVTAATDPDDILVFSRPRALALMTRRRVSAGYNPVDPCRLWQYMREIGASYVITGPARDPFNEDAVYLRQFVAKFGDDLRPVMANRDLAVYRIERDPCQPGNLPQ